MTRQSDSTSETELPAREVFDRMKQHASHWRVVVEETLHTETSLIAFGVRHNQPVVLKVIKKPGDEWRSGEVLSAFDGNGSAQVYEYADGAVLMGRLRPGNALVSLVRGGRDEEATDVLADLMHRMASREIPGGCPTVEDWGKGFARYIASGDQQVPADLVERSQRIFSQLCANQRHQRLLHGDLQHYNVLFDAERGWVAIDPKGVVGELEYEVGAMLRNPVEVSDLFASREKIERRLKTFSKSLKLDFNRMLSWGYAQAVLSAIWDIEDGFALDAQNASLLLAEALEPMIGNGL